MGTRFVASSFRVAAVAGASFAAAYDPPFEGVAFAVVAFAASFESVVGSPAVLQSRPPFEKGSSSLPFLAEHALVVHPLLLSLHPSTLWQVVSCPFPRRSRDLEWMSRRILIKSS